MLLYLLLVVCINFAFKIAVWMYNVSRCFALMCWSFPLNRLSLRQMKRLLCKRKHGDAAKVWNIFILDLMTLLAPFQLGIFWSLLNIIAYDVTEAEKIELLSCIEYALLLLLVVLNTVVQRDTICSLKLLLLIEMFIWGKEFSPFLLCTHVQSWDLFFRNANAGQTYDPHLADQLERKASFLQSHGLAQTPGKAEKLVEDHLAVQSLIRAYQVSVPWGRGEKFIPLWPIFSFLWMFSFFFWS